MKILLIDDSRVLRHAHERAFAKAGYEVLTAKDGEEGLRIARENSPDLVLLDLMLPRIAGEDVLRTLKGDSRTKRIPVVVLSGLSGVNGPKLMDEGAVEFLQKTDYLLENNSERLVKAVQALFSKPSISHEVSWH